MLPASDLTWNVLTSEYLHREPWLTVRRESVALPGGHIIPSYFVLEYPPWVNVIGITKEGAFILVRQYRHGLGSVGFELCAGVCDPTDASPLEGARRELLEETGYGNGEWQEWMVISANPSTQNNLTYCYLATGLERVSSQHLEPSEEITVHLCSLEEIRRMLAENRFMQALHAAPLWKYIASLQEPSLAADTRL
jgi:ADP-ribose pyrophosphatase